MSPFGLRDPLYLRAPLATLGAAVAGIGAAYGWVAVQRADRWYGNMPATMSAFTVASALPAVGIALLGAWVGGQTRRWACVEWFLISGRTAVELNRKSLLVSWGVGACVSIITFLFMCVATLSRQPGLDSSSLSLLLVLPTVLAQLSVFAAVGVVFGRFTPRAVALCASAAAPYLVYFVAAWYPDVPGMWALETGESGQWVYVVRSLGSMVVKLVLWVALAAAASFVALGLTAAARRTMYAVSFAVAAAIVSGHGMAEVAGGSDRVCRAGAIEVCTDRAHAVILKDYQAAVVRVAGQLPQVMRPSRVVTGQELVVSAGDRVVPSLSTDGFTDTSFVVDPEKVSVAYVDTLLDNCRSRLPAKDARRLEDVASFLMLWWRHRLGLPRDVMLYGGGPVFGGPLSAEEVAAQRLAGTSPATQRAWLEAQGHALAACDIDAVVLP